MVVCVCNFCWMCDSYFTRFDMFNTGVRGNEWKFTSFRILVKLSTTIYLECSVLHAGDVCWVFHCQCSTCWMFHCQCSTCWRRVLGVSLSVFYMLESCAGCFIASVLHAGCFIVSVLHAGDVCWVFHCQCSTRWRRVLGVSLNSQYITFYFQIYGFWLLLWYLLS
jgi:hypothetical protein